MFTAARLKLTGFYILLLALVIGGFSLFLFRYTAQHIHDSIEEDTPPTAAQQRSADRAVDGLQNTLVTSDILIIVLASGFAYVLAGRTLEPIKRSHKAQMQFGANASHELRTPLAVMKMENEVFLRQAGTSLEASSLARSNIEEIDRMAGMVEELLLLARSSGDMSLKLTRVDVSAVLQRVVGKLKGSAVAKGLTLVFEGPAQAYTKGNEQLLDQLCTNLLQNAIAHTDAGGITASILVQKKIHITITDTGSGISKEDLPHLTTPFYKTASGKRLNGVGLGLSIAQEIVHRHGGGLSFASEVGKGTEARVTLASFS
ncbi:MAG: putative Histidine kinase [Parcubacteria group bacterium]|nr:putative Histidine kinase [Parcubacteria group bacterium]